MPTCSGLTNFRLVWPYSRAPAVVAAWQDRAARGPDELAADLALTALADQGDPVAEIFGAAARDQRDADELLGDLVARVGSAAASDFRVELSFRDTVRSQAGHDQAGPSRVHRFAKSEFFDRPQEMHAAKAWVMASWAAVRPWGSGRVYPNFPDPDLDDWAQAYYGASTIRTASSASPSRPRHNSARQAPPAPPISTPTGSSPARTRNSLREGEMISAVDKININVRDQDAARRFWIQTMGFSLVTDEPTHQELTAPGWLPQESGTQNRSALLFQVMGVSASASTRRRRASDNDTGCPNPQCGQTEGRRRPGRERRMLTANLRAGRCGG